MDVLTAPDMTVNCQVFPTLQVGSEYRESSAICIAACPHSNSRHSYVGLLLIACRSSYYSPGKTAGIDSIPKQQQVGRHAYAEFTHSANGRTLGQFSSKDSLRCE